MAPAGDVIGLVKNLPTVRGGSVFASYVAAAYAATYPQAKTDSYLEPSARTLVREMSTRCLSEPGVLVSVLSALSIDKDRSRTCSGKDRGQTRRARLQRAALNDRLHLLSWAFSAP